MLSLIASLCISANVYHEARQDGVEGMTMVAHVTMNRANHDPKNACDQIFKHKQFSWTNRLLAASTLSDKLTIAKRLIPKEKESWDLAYQIGIDAVQGRLDHQVVEQVGSADHYYAPDKANPSWAKTMRHIAYIGNHRVLESNQRWN